MDELDPPSKDTKDKSNSVELRSAHFLWEEAEEPITLVQNTKVKDKCK